jgi:hypothetical protein
MGRGPDNRGRVALDNTKAGKSNNHETRAKSGDPPLSGSQRTTKLGVVADVYSGRVSHGINGFLLAPVLRKLLALIMKTANGKNVDEGDCYVFFPATYIRPKPTRVEPYSNRSVTGPHDVDESVRWEQSSFRSLCVEEMDWGNGGFLGPRRLRWVHIRVSQPCGLSSFGPLSSIISPVTWTGTGDFGNNHTRTHPRQHCVTLNIDTG